MAAPAEVPVASGSGASRAPSEGSEKRVKVDMWAARESSPTPSRSGRSSSSWASSFRGTPEYLREPVSVEEIVRLHERANLDQFIRQAMVERDAADLLVRNLLESWRQTHGEEWVEDAA